MKMPQNSAPNRNRQMETRQHARSCRATAPETRTGPPPAPPAASSQPHHEIRHHLAQHDFGRPQRRGEHLLHGAHLPFAGDGQRGQQRGDDLQDHRDQPRHHVVLRFERAVVPDAQPRIHRRPRRARRRAGSCMSGAQLPRNNRAPRFRRSPCTMEAVLESLPSSSICTGASLARGQVACRIVARNHHAHEDVVACRWRARWRRSHRRIRHVEIARARNWRIRSRLAGCRPGRR